MGSVEAGPRSEDQIGVRVVLSDPSVRAVIGVVSVMMFGFGIVLPILPLYARSFGVGYGEAGVMLSAFAIARLVFDLLAGPIIDRVGERRAGTVGMVFVALCAFLTGVAPTYVLAVVAWGVGGAGSSVVFAALFSFLLRVVPKDRMARTMGIFYGAFNVGLLGGGFVGGVAADAFGLASPLFLYAALMLVTTAGYWTLTGDPPDVGERDIDDQRGLLGRGRGTIASLLRVPGFKTAIFLNLAYLWVITGIFDTLVPLLAGDRLGASTLGIGVIFAAVLATELAVLYPAGAIADRRGRRFVLIPALAAFAVTAAAVGWSPNMLVLGVLAGVMGFASGAAGVPPAAMLSDVTPERERGTGVGIYRFCGDLGFVLGPVVAGVSADALGFRAAFAISTVPVLIALVAVLRTPETLGWNRDKSGVSSRA